MTKSIQATIIGLLSGATLLWAGAAAGGAVQASSASEANTVHRPSASDVADATLVVEGYVYGKPPAADSMKIFDWKEQKVVTLTLSRLHRYEARPMEDGNLAICAEFKSDTDKDYMLWFIVGSKGSETRLVYGKQYAFAVPWRKVVKDVVIHKVDGQERVRWHEENGVWKLKTVEDTQAAE